MDVPEKRRDRVEGRVIRENFDSMVKALKEGLSDGHPVTIEPLWRGDYRVWFDVKASELELATISDCVSDDEARLRLELSIYDTKRKGHDASRGEAMLQEVDWQRRERGISAKWHLTDRQCEAEAARLNDAIRFDKNDIGGKS